MLRYDARSGSGSGPLFALDAHSDAVSVVAHNPKVPGLVLTASHDKTVKLWNVVNNKPAALATKKLDLVTMHPVPSTHSLTACGSRELSSVHRSMETRLLSLLLVERYDAQRIATHSLSSFVCMIVGEIEDLGLQRERCCKGLLSRSKTRAVCSSCGYDTRRC